MSILASLLMQGTTVGGTYYDLPFPPEVCLGIAIVSIPFWIGLGLVAFHARRQSQGKDK